MRVASKRGRWVKKQAKLSLCQKLIIIIIFLLNSLPSSALLSRSERVDSYGFHWFKHVF